MCMQQKSTINSTDADKKATDEMKDAGSNDGARNYDIAQPSTYIKMIPSIGAHNLWLHVIIFEINIFQYCSKSSLVLWTRIFYH